MIRTKRPHRARPTIEPLEVRAVPAGFRSIDGTGNNADHAEWGSAGVTLLRTAPVAYADGIDDPVVGNPPRPSPRVISNRVVAQTTEERVFSDRLMSAMIYGWGQFLDHDLDLTTGASPREDFPIQVPPDDPVFTSDIPFNRSKSVYVNGVRQQPNEITAFVDASMVYGSSDAVARALRTVVDNGPDGLFGTDDDVLGATLKTSPGNLLPFNSLTYFSQAQLNALHMGNDTHAVQDSELFAAGDIRANENIELTSLHTLFVREHNRLAGLIAADNPALTDEEVYQRARAIVGAEMQVITYNQWIPTLLGPSPLPAYTVYKPGVNPGIANEFSTALFRLGHSMLGEDVEFIGNNGEELAEEIPLHEAFTNPGKVSLEGIDPILKYLVSDPSSEVDNTIVDEVRNLLFNVPGGQIGFDLSALNIQRGRDHGQADYNSVRGAYRLSRVSSFAGVNPDNGIQRRLHDLYENVDNIDLWIGGLAEQHVSGSSTGRLIRTVLVDQFTRLRDGDRFWYQNQTIAVPVGALPSGAATLGSVTLADVIAANTDNTRDHLQNNVFFFKPTISGQVFNDGNRNGVRDAGEAVLGGRTVQIEDPETGEVLVTTTTDSNGRYSVDVFEGVTLGQFNVREIPQNGWVLTTDNPVLITLFKGDQNEVVNFGNAKGSALLAATAGSAGVEALTAGELQPIVADAVARWQAAGLAPEGVNYLGGVDVQIADLPGDTLGLSSADGVTIDVNAGGYGWFVDPTPANDVEFPAAVGSPAYGRMDLLTVVAHELGHQLGLEHSNEDGDVMGATLATGVREVPTSADIGTATDATPPAASTGTPAPTAAGATSSLAGVVFGTALTSEASVSSEPAPSSTRLPALVTAGADSVPLLLADDRQQAWAMPTGETASLDLGFNLSLADDPTVPGLWPPQ
jgi:hypothetical protein